MASPRCFAMNARLPAEGDAPRSTVRNEKQATHPSPKCGEFTLTGCNSAKPGPAGLEPCEVPPGIAQKADHGPETPVLTREPQPPAALPRTVAERAGSTSGGSFSWVSRSLQAIRNPVSDVPKGYIALSGSRKPTRLFETRFARPTSRGARETGAPAGSE